MDLRPPFTAAVDAFSVPAVVTPQFGFGLGDPITTKVIWITPLPEDQPVGRDYTAREPRRVMALRRDEVPDVPRGTLIAAAETIGGVSRDWQIDGVESTDVDHFRVFVIPKTS